MSFNQELNLNQLPLGSLGQVVHLETQGIMRRRLLDLGLVPGTLVEAVRKSPAGDPVAYKIRGAIIALRSEESRLVTVRPLA